MKGFTLIELMVTIAIVAISMTLVVPGYKGAIARNQAATAANTVLSIQMLARSEAVRQGARVSICPTSNTSAKPPVCAGSWLTSTLMVFRDSNGDCTVDQTNPNDTDANIQRKGEDYLIRQFDAPGITQIQQSGADLAAGACVTWTGLGQPNAATTMKVCPATSQPHVQGSQISVNGAGRAHTTAGGC